MRQQERSTKEFGGFRSKLRQWSHIDQDALFLILIVFIRYAQDNDLLEYWIFINKGAGENDPAKQLVPWNDPDLPKVRCYFELDRFADTYRCVVGAVLVFHIFKLKIGQS